MNDDVEAGAELKRTTRARISVAGTSALPAGVRVASEWTWRLGLFALGIYAATRVLAEFSVIVISLLLALMLTALLHPVVGLAAQRLPRGVSSLAVLLGWLLLVLALLALVGQQTASGFPDLISQATAGIDQVQRWLSTGPLNIPTGRLSSYTTQLNDYVSSNTSTLLSGALGATTTVSHVLEGFFIMMFSTFFFLSAGHRIWAWLLRMLPTAAQAPMDNAARSGWVTLGHYVRATSIVAIVDGVGIGLGAALLGVPLALPLGVLVFLGAFIPVVGATITGLLAVLVALVAQGWVTALAVLGVVIAVNQLEAHILQPFLLGRAVDVHPLGVILSLSAGYTLAGIPGALFAVPVAAVGNTMITTLASHGHRDPGEEIAEDGAPLAPDKPAATDPDEVPNTQRSSITGDRIGE
ncbi:MAG: AI-2E family transporter [Nocardioidaceae bacterium]